MSAFIVGKPHIDAMIRLGLKKPTSRLRWFAVDPSDEGWTYEEHIRELSAETADTVGQMLTCENVLSVRHRYPAVDTGGTAPDPLDAYWKYPYTYSALQTGRIPTAVEGLKLLDCYEYQTCERDAWNDSEARRFCEALRSRLIESVVGYDEAPWGWTGEPLVRA